MMRARSVARDSVTHRVLVNVAKPRKIRPLHRDERVPVLKPDLSAIYSVDAIDAARCERMQVGDDRTNAASAPGCADEMVMIREDGPRLEARLMLFANLKQALLKEVQFLC